MGEAAIAGLGANAVDDAADGAAGAVGVEDGDAEGFAYQVFEFDRGVGAEGGDDMLAGFA